MSIKASASWVLSQPLKLSLFLDFTEVTLVFIAFFFKLNGFFVWFFLRKFGWSGSLPLPFWWCSYVDTRLDNFPRFLQSSNVSLIFFCFANIRLLCISFSNFVSCKHLRFSWISFGSFFALYDEFLDFRHRFCDFFFIVFAIQRFFANMVLFSFRLSINLWNIFCTFQSHSYYFSYIF